MTKPRLLLVPTICELEWRIKPQLEEWAEVASFDAPGVGAEAKSETGYTIEAIAERGLDELERLGWDSYVVVGDEFGSAGAVRIAARHPKRVRALALGHPTLSLRASGERAPVNAEVRGAFVQLARTDYGSYVQALGQITQHAYDEEWVQAYRERVPQEAAMAYEGFQSDAVGDAIEEEIRSLNAPLLFVEHQGCLLFTQEGFEDAAAAFPEAETAATEAKPSADPAFSELLREFCSRLPG